MPPQSTHGDAVEVAVILAFLGRGGRATAPSELYVEVREPGATPTLIDAAVDALLDTGLLRRAANGRLCASRALDHLDELGLIGV